MDESQDDSQEEERGDSEIRVVCHQRPGIRQDHKTATISRAESGPLPLLIKLFRHSVGGGSEGPAEEDVSPESSQTHLPLLNNLVPRN